MQSKGLGGPLFSRDWFARRYTFSNCCFCREHFHTERKYFVTERWRVFSSEQGQLFWAAAPQINASINHVVCKGHHGQQQQYRKNNSRPVDYCLLRQTARRCPVLIGFR